MQNSKFYDWQDAMDLRNAYYNGIFAARKSGKDRRFLPSPKSNSWEENIFWRLGVQDGSATVSEASSPVREATAADSEVDLSAFDL